MPRGDSFLVRWNGVHPGRNPENFTLQGGNPSKKIAGVKQNTSTLHGGKGLFTLK
jgi:hypothetical protein